jgi:hypothetical protein
MTAIPVRPWTKSLYSYDERATQAVAPLPLRPDAAPVSSYLQSGFGLST